MEKNQKKTMMGNFFINRNRCREILLAPAISERDIAIESSYVTAGVASGQFQPRWPEWDLSYQIPTQAGRERIPSYR
jgi:hypothetical protein